MNQNDPRHAKVSTSEQPRRTAEELSARAKLFLLLDLAYMEGQFGGMSAEQLHKAVAGLWNYRHVNQLHGLLKRLYAQGYLWKSKYRRDGEPLSLYRYHENSPRGVCRVCGCTDSDCRYCIERTGEPCSWVDPTLCSACELRYEPKDFRPIRHRRDPI